VHIVSFSHNQGDAGNEQLPRYKTSAESIAILASERQRPLWSTIATQAFIGNALIDMPMRNVARPLAAD